MPGGKPLFSFVTTTLDEAWPQHDRQISLCCRLKPIPGRFLTTDGCCCPVIGIFQSLSGNRPRSALRFFSFFNRSRPDIPMKRFLPKLGRDLLETKYKMMKTIVSRCLFPLVGYQSHAYDLSTRRTRIWNQICAQIMRLMDAMSPDTSQHQETDQWLTREGTRTNEERLQTVQGMDLDRRSDHIPDLW